MKIHGPIILIGYIVGFGFLFSALTGWKEENKIGVILLFVAFILGWFFVITYLVERENKSETTHIAERTARQGVEFIKMWLAYLLALLIIGAIGSFLLLGL